MTRKVMRRLISTFMAQILVEGYRPDRRDTASPYNAVTPRSSAGPIRRSASAALRRQARPTSGCLEKHGSWRKGPSPAGVGPRRQQILWNIIATPSVLENSRSRSRKGRILMAPRATTSQTSIVSEVEDKGREALEAVSDVRDNMAIAIEKSLKKRPYTTLVLAVGVGFLLGALWAR